MNYSFQQESQIPQVPIPTTQHQFQGIQQQELPSNARLHVQTSLYDTSNSRHSHAVGSASGFLTLDRQANMQQNDSLQPRRRALLTDETAREIFKLRGRLAAADRAAGKSSSMFTASSILVSQVVAKPASPNPQTLAALTTQFAPCGSLAE